MALIFPNRSRSFDEARKAVRFLGHDGMFEVPFLIRADALAGQGSSEMTEADCLAAFDAARDLIHEVALRAYSRGRSTILTAADFR
jgi:Protein of unknown function (DUF1488)